MKKLLLYYRKERYFNNISFCCGAATKEKKNLLEKLIITMTATLAPITCPENNNLHTRCICGLCKVRCVCDLYSQQHGVPEGLFRRRECYPNPPDSNSINNVIPIVTRQSNTNRHGSNKVDRSEVVVEPGGMKVSSSNTMVVYSKIVQEQVGIKLINNINFI